MAGHPETGPHAERMIQELKREIQHLPGTTFSDPESRGAYDSVGNAMLTLGELETYLFTWILGTYHQRPHGGLDGKTPLEKWQEGIEGTGQSPGLGEPPMPKDPQRFYLDFLPCEQRKVVRDGVRLNNIWYQSETLRDLVGSRVTGQGCAPGKLLIRFDPLDLSRIYVVDPRTDAYLVVPYRDTSLPPITLREVKMVRKEIRARYNSPSTEERLFAERERLKALAASAIKKTKHARVLHARERRLLNLGPVPSKPQGPPLTDPLQEPDPIQEIQMAKPDQPEPTRWEEEDSPVSVQQTPWPDDSLDLEVD